jgi:hypothetical protein
MTTAVHPRAVRFAALAGFVLHTLAVLLLWRSWDEGLRGSLLVLIDLPVALFYLSATQEHLLAWSLALGGAQWALLTALLTVLVGRISARRRRPA